MKTFKKGEEVPRNVRGVFVSKDVIFVKFW